MTEDNKAIDPKILDEIIEAVQRMKYGEVVITIYDSKVVQIEEKKKKRFV
ncbi:MAG: YezD family protein [Candidatus Omnitrophica bacterium]|nr:YezD family protein [Candidatus Omnitrophota bacterium]